MAAKALSPLSGGNEYEYNFSAGFANGGTGQNFSDLDEYWFSDVSVYATVTIDNKPVDWDDSSGWEIDIEHTFNVSGVDYLLSFEAQWIENKASVPFRRNKGRYRLDLTDAETREKSTSGSAGYESTSDLFTQQSGSIYRISENQSGTCRSMEALKSSNQVDRKF